MKMQFMKITSLVATGTLATMCSAAAAFADTASEQEKCSAAEITFIQKRAIKYAVVANEFYSVIKNGPEDTGYEIASTELIKTETDCTGVVRLRFSVPQALFDQDISFNSDESVTVSHAHFIDSD